MTWQTIDSVPHDRLIDVWIKSRNNPEYCRRATNVYLFMGDVWRGDSPPNLAFGEYASHWMFLPEPPKVESNGQH